MEEFTVENFHSVICRHIKGPKEQFNYRGGWREGKKRRGGGQVNWKISGSDRRQKRIHAVLCPVFYFLH